MFTSKFDTMSAILSIKPLGFPWETQDPFLFCVYHRDEFPEGNGEMGVDRKHLVGRNIGNDFTIKDGWRMYHGQSIPGFPFHPHRGFETITINKEGFVDHTDSLGAAGRFGAGDTQWMTAGRGVQHSEMFPLINSDKGNPMEIFQIWLNLPKASKFVEPHFKMLWNEEIPVLSEKDGNGNVTEVQIIAGELKGIKAFSPTPDSWAAKPENHVSVLTIKMEAYAKWMLPGSSKEANRTLFFYKGSSVSIDGTAVNAGYLAHVDPTAEIEIHNGDQEAFMLMLQGKPINEPVAKYGPFVMNTQDEIRQAMMDFQRTQFGGWPWPNQEQVHDKDAGRFALHADGRKEQK